MPVSPKEVWNNVKFILKYTNSNDQPEIQAKKYVFEEHSAYVTFFDDVAGLGASARVGSFPTGTLQEIRLERPENT